MIEKCSSMHWRAHRISKKKYLSIPFHFISVRIVSVWRIVFNFFYLLFFFYFSFFPFSFICFLFGFGSFYYYLALGGTCIHSRGFHLFLYIIFVIIYLRLLHTVFNFCTCFELHESVHWWMCALHCVDPIETINKQTNQINHRCICFCRFKERITFAWSANKSKASGQHCCNIIA